MPHPTQVIAEAVFTANDLTDTDKQSSTGTQTYEACDACVKNNNNTMKMDFSMHTFFYSGTDIKGLMHFSKTSIQLDIQKLVAVIQLQHHSDWARAKSDSLFMCLRVAA